MRAPERYPAANVLVHEEGVPDTHILIQGNFKTKGEKVEPGFPAALNPGPPIDEPKGVHFIPQRRKAPAVRSPIEHVYRKRYFEWARAYQVCPHLL